MEKRKNLKFCENYLELSKVNIKKDNSGEKNERIHEKK